MEAALPRPWTDLPQDLLGCISGRLHDAADFVRFHAVCKPWRDTLPTTSSSHPAFLPWILSPGSYYRPSIALFRSIFSGITWCAPGTSGRRCKWLASADGAGAWLLAVGSGGADQSPPRLVNPFTGAGTTLPPLPGLIRRFVARAKGLVCADGTVVLYAVDGCHEYASTVVAAVLRPGDAAWTAAESHRMPYSSFKCSCAAAYRDGEIVIVDALQDYIVTLRLTGGEVVLPVMRTIRETETPPGELGCIHYCIYALESRGELLAVCLLQHTTVKSNGGVSIVPGVVSLSIFALEQEAADGGARWVRRDGRSLSDRVLFLGNPTSFAVDAARFGGAVSGGCAYFVVNSRRTGWTKMPKACRVYRYSFEDGAMTVVEEMPAGSKWDADERLGPGCRTAMMWFIPQPSTHYYRTGLRQHHISTGWAKTCVDGLSAPAFGSNATTPAHETRERRLQAPPNGKKGAPCHPRSIIRVQRTGFWPFLKIFVGNLPLWLGSFQLKQFFDNHGKVEDARVIYDTQTGRSWGFGFVTMATECEPADAIAALDGEIFYGYTLRVKFGEERPEGPFVMSLLASYNEAASTWW
ncbi:hypothetical protein ACP70R_005846 [Stipagrostis hirtigluma subsp. patula]